MCRRAMSANSAVVNMPQGATNSFSGRVHGAVASWSRYSPAWAATSTTTSAMPCSMAVAASVIMPTPNPSPCHAGPSRRS